MYQPVSEKLWSFMEAARTADNLDLLARRFQELVAPYGVEASSVAFLGQGDRRLAHGLGLPPREWGTHYSDEKYALTDPILHSLTVRRTEGFWSDHLEGRRLNSQETLVMSDAEDFGWHDGFNKIYRPDEVTPLLLNLIGSRLDHSDEAYQLFNVAGFILVEEAYKFVVRKSGQTGMFTLTDRQKQILELIANGWPHKEVAAELGISPRTVEVHVANIKDRLGVKSISEAVLMMSNRGRPMKSQPSAQRPQQS